MKTLQFLNVIVWQPVETNSTHIKTWEQMKENQPTKQKINLTKMLLKMLLQDKASK